ncbi:MAG: SemiSWEET transporter [Candidatus Kapaibacteriales bacterium]
MEISTIVGSLAAILTTSSFIPQAIKIIRTRSTKDISLWMYIVLSTGSLCWLIYGILLLEAPLIFANVIGFSLTFIILILKIRYEFVNGNKD